MTRSPIFAHAADLYREMRREFDVVLEAAYAAAEEGTGGSLLNAAGRAAPVDAYSLLTGPWSRVLKYGSPELIEWFQFHGRPSVAEFEREWFHARHEPEEEPDDYEPTALYRVVQANGDLWMESRDESWCRASYLDIPGSSFERLYRRRALAQWREAV